MDGSLEFVQHEIRPVEVGNIFKTSAHSDIRLSLDDINNDERRSAVIVPIQRRFWEDEVEHDEGRSGEQASLECLILQMNEKEIGKHQRIGLLILEDTGHGSFAFKELLSAHRTVEEKIITLI